MYVCECVECGHKVKTAEHCKDLECSKCGGQMRREERPGPGQESQAPDVTKIVRMELPISEDPKSKQAQALKRGIKLDEKTGDLRFTAVAVDKQKTPNRKGFVFGWNNPADVNVEPLKENGRLYWMHESDGFPVGFIEEVQVNSRSVRFQGLIPGDSHFADGGESTQLAAWVREIREAVKSGLVKAVSIGFYIREYEERDDHILVTKMEIIEISIVTIGAHASALIEQGTPESVGEQFGAELQLQPAGWKDTSKRSKVLHKLSLKAPEELDWPTVAKSMAVALGARGADPSEEKYKALLPHYKRFGVEPPEWFHDYTPAELLDFQDEGLLQVPGTEKPENEPTPVENALAALQEAVSALSRRVESLGTVERESADTGADTEAGDDNPSPEPSPVLDVEALRQTIRKQIQQDPVLAKARQEAVQKALEKIRAANNER